MNYKELNDLTTHANENSAHSFRDLWERFLKNWYWFAIGLLLAWGSAYFYLRYAQNYYTAEAKVLIKEDAMRTNSELSALAGKSLGGLDGKSNITDQIEVMRSRRLVGKVVNNLQLNVRYFSEGRVKTQELMPTASPVQIRVFSEEIHFVNFSVQILSPMDLKIIYNENAISTSFGKKVKIGNNELVILPAHPENIKAGNEIQVTVEPEESIISWYRNKINITPVNDGSVISISMVDNLSQRAKMVIDELIDQYNKDAILDKQLVGEKTTAFIEERLRKVSEDLSAKDQDVEMFKKRNQVIDLEAEGGTSIGQSNANHDQYLNQSTQLSLVESMDNYLKNNQKALVPTNIGLNDGSVNNYAQQYNELILAKNDLLKHSTASSQIVQNLDSQIQDVYANLSQSLKNYKSSIQITLNRIDQEGGRISTKIHAFPTQEKEFKNIARQQQIVEALYLFLLQKREENEITNSATPSAIKVVDFAYSNNASISPNRKMIYSAATAIGLALPFGLLYLMFLLNNKVQSRKDLAYTGISVIGEVPYAKSQKTIHHNDHGVLAESLRILRTNIGFYTHSKQENAKKIFVTSTLSGEGKTFITANLALILAASQKNKVLIVGADIRNPSLLNVLNMSHLSSHKGLTEFMAERHLQLEDVLLKKDDWEVDVIHSGVMAPNPSELLMNGRFQQLMEVANERYDYILVDTAPMSLVTDTQLIAGEADLFLYVVRANFLDKRMLDFSKEMYEQKRLPNMTLVLNDVGRNSSYGYGYGYTYGYGNQKKGWVARLLGKFKN